MEDRPSDSTVRVVDGVEDRPRLRGQIGTAGVVFLVLAFAAPLAASVSNIPLAYSLNQGVGIPGVWLCCAAVLALFSVGYVEMSKHVTDAGAFSAYIGLALGPRAGAAAGYVAVVAYSSGVILITGFFGFFASIELSTLFGWNVSWYVCGLLGLLVAAVVSLFGVTGSVRLLIVLLVVEGAFLVVWNLGVLSEVGIGAYPLSSFAPGNVLTGAVGGVFAFAFSTFLGFEATAIYGEEAKNPSKVVRHATYAALGVITLLYTCTAWSTVAAASSAQFRAAADDPGSLFPVLTDRILGGPAADILGILLMTSLFAVMLASLNSAARYLFSLSRVGVLPSALTGIRTSSGAPGIALTVQALLAAAVVAGYALAGADPFAQLGATFVGLSALGVVGLECALSVAVVVFFLRPGNQLGAGRWATLVAPALSALGLGGAAVAIIANFPLISGSTEGFVSFLPLVLAAAALGGFVIGGAPRAERAAERDQD